MRNRHFATPRRRLGAAWVPGLICITMAALAGCSGSGSVSSSSAAANGAVAAPAALPSGSGGAKSEAGAGQGVTATRLVPADQQIIYTAQLTVRASDIATAISRATSIVASAGGYVSAENASSDPNHPAQSTATIELKIPVAGRRHEQPGRLRRGGDRPAPGAAQARRIGRGPAQRAEPDQLR
jgi:Domain of unknown function (DUF4349)